MGRKTPLILALIAAVVPSAAAAQSANVDTFDTSGGLFDNQGTLQLAHPHIGMSGSWYGGLGVVYAHNPLVYVAIDENGEESREVIVGKQLSTRVVGGYNIGAIARVDLEVPVYPSVTVEDASSFAMGDIRLGATIPLVKYEETGFGLALVPALSFPTGSTDAYLSNGGIGAGITAAAGVQAGMFGAVANIGIDATKKTTIGDYTLGSAMPFGLGFNLKLAESFRLGLEGDGHMTLVNGALAYNVTPVEAHLYGTYGTGEGIGATLGVGRGVVAGMGAPDIRVFLGLTWRDPGAPPDADKDGLVDEEDTCPLEPEDFDNYEDSDGCPDPNNDGDGLMDKDDKCPNNAEDADGFEDTDGCPDPDNDQDGLADAEDRCPLEAGPASTSGCPDRDSDGLADSDDECPDQGGPKETNGCPDADNDRVPDMRDACPNEPADSRVDPRRSNGCPSRVVVTSKSIMILEMVYFETNKAVIKPVSFGLLDDVAKTLNTYTDIQLVEVQGHTDNVGNDASNLKLSQARAEAVMKYLVNKGVDPTRLQAKGYGETQPIDSNDTAEGRAKNRRVAFTILKQ